MSVIAYPEPEDHEPKYWVIDGRHRYSAAVFRGSPIELRCDVIADGHALRVIPVRHLAVDPDVQFPFAYNERWARRIAMSWDERKVGVLTVNPIEGALSLAERASIKRGLDGDRRHVSAVEEFLSRVQCGDERACAIERTARDTGWFIGKLRSGGKPYDTIASIRLLERIYDGMGKDGLRKTLTLGTHWRGDPSANTGDWLGALSLLVRDGYDDRLTPAAWQRWEKVVPALELRRAMGEARGVASGKQKSASEVSYIVATSLRKKAGLRPTPARGKNGHATRQRDI